MRNRKLVLVNMIEMFQHRTTPGQKLALQIAIALVKRATVRQISQIASELENGDVFWEKQWKD